MIRASDLDQRCSDALARMPAYKAVHALDFFSTKARHITADAQVCA
jgi:hypothetical protein